MPSITRYLAKIIINYIDTLSIRREILQYMISGITNIKLQNLIPYQVKYNHNFRIQFPYKVAQNYNYLHTLHGRLITPTKFSFPFPSTKNNIPPSHNHMYHLLNKIHKLIDTAMTLSTYKSKVAYSLMSCNNAMIQNVVSNPPDDTMDGGICISTQKSTTETVSSNYNKNIKDKRKCN